MGPELGGAMPQSLNLSFEDEDYGACAGMKMSHLKKMACV